MFPWFCSSLCFALLLGYALTCLISCLWLCFARINVFMCFSPCFMLRSASVHVYMLGFAFFHVYVLGYTCLHACFYAYMPRSTFSHTCVLGSMSYTLLCYLPCACALHAMFVCLDLGYVCHAMCCCSPFVTLSFFLVF